MRWMASILNKHWTHNDCEHQTLNIICHYTDFSTSMYLYIKHWTYWNLRESSEKKKQVLSMPTNQNRLLFMSESRHTYYKFHFTLCYWKNNTCYSLSIPKGDWLGGFSWIHFLPFNERMYILEMLTIYKIVFFIKVKQIHEWNENEKKKIVAALFQSLIQCLVWLVLWFVMCLFFYVLYCKLTRIQLYTYVSPVSLLYF